MLDTLVFDLKLPRRKWQFLIESTKIREDVL